MSGPAVGLASLLDPSAGHLQQYRAARRRAPWCARRVVHTSLFLCVSPLRAGWRGGLLPSRPATGGFMRVAAELQLLQHAES